MLWRHCLALWLALIAIQVVGIYLMYVVKTHFSPATEKSYLTEKSYENLIDVPRPMATGPFGTLFFPPSDNSNNGRALIDAVGHADGKTEDRTPPSLFSILASPVGLYILCSFIPLIFLCLVALCVICTGKESALDLGNRPALLEAGLAIPYQRLEPGAMEEPLARRIFPCRAFGS